MGLKFQKVVDTAQLSKKVFCNRCGTGTIHNALTAVRKEYVPDEEYGGPDFWTSYQIIQCNGCLDISFMEDRANSEHTEGFGDDERLVHEFSFYPEHLSMNRKIQEAKTIPSIIFELYRETIILVSKRMFRFAALGLRLLIEELAKDQGASRYHLDSKLKELLAASIISSDEKEVLEILKVYGDDAAHKDEIQPEKILKLGVDIMESIIIRIYVFKEQHAELLDAKSPICDAP